MDVTFEQRNRPFVNSDEKNRFHSDKHHLHGRNVEVSVNSRGFAINCTNCTKGSVADLQVFRHNLEFHEKMSI